MAYVDIPKDLTRVKTKVMFNLTKRQLICFGSGALYRRTAVLSCKGEHPHQRGGAHYDSRHAALLHVGNL